jgi:GMP synthase-like glutamine amidotransferase
LDRGDRIPDLGECGAVIVLGGPMNVDEERRFPWLFEEKAALRRTVDAGIPVVGICLGSQLLARSFVAQVKRNPVKEIGWSAVTFTDEGKQDQMFSGLGGVLPVFQWHGDTFDLPDSAILLATSTLCAHQAFRVGKRAYGLQFHIEVKPHMIAECVGEYRTEVEQELPAGAAERMIAQAYATQDAMRGVARSIWDRFVDIAVIRQLENTERSETKKGGI